MTPCACCRTRRASWTWWTDGGARREFCRECAIRLGIYRESLGGAA